MCSIVAIKLKRKKRIAQLQGKFIQVAAEGGEMEICHRGEDSSLMEAIVKTF